MYSVLTGNTVLYTSTTGYRVYRLVLATQPCTLVLTTGYRVCRLVLVTQPCTLALITGYRVYRLVLATQSCTLASTYWLQSLLTGCWLHSPYCTVLHPNWLQKKKKKKKKSSWLNIDQWLSKFMDDPSLLEFCYRELLVTVKYRVGSPGTGQSYLRLIWLQRILGPVSGLGDMTGI